MAMTKQQRAGRKAVATRRRNEERAKRQLAAHKAWITRRRNERKISKRK